MFASEFVLIPMLKQTNKQKTRLPFCPNTSGLYCKSVY